MAVDFALICMLSGKDASAENTNGTNNKGGIAAALVSGFNRHT